MDSSRVRLYFPESLYMKIQGPGLRASAPRSAAASGTDRGKADADDHHFDVDRGRSRLDVCAVGMAMSCPRSLRSYSCWVPWLFVTRPITRRWLADTAHIR